MSKRALYEREGMIPGSPGLPWPDALVDPDTVTDTTQDARWRPLKITTTCPLGLIIGPDGINLDGLLSAAACIVYKERPYTERYFLPEQQGSAWIVDFELPLARWVAPIKIKPSGADPRLTVTQPDGSEAAWGWCASNVNAQWVARERINFRGKTPTNELCYWTDAKSVNVASGPFKGIDLGYEKRIPKDGLLTWYALGDAQGVRDLLARITYLGKKHNVGMGKVTCDLYGVPEWHVEEVAEDLSCTRADGSLARQMPWSGVGPGRIAGVRPPYWHSARWMMCGGPYDP